MKIILAWLRMLCCERKEQNGSRSTALDQGALEDHAVGTILVPTIGPALISKF